MLKDIVEARPAGGYKLYLRFEDGVEGEIDLSKLVEFKGVFETLRDFREVAKVRVDAEHGTVSWPNGADLDPDVLYSLLTGKPIELRHLIGEGELIKAAYKLAVENWRRAERVLVRSICPLYCFEGGIPGICGSGVLLRIGGVPFLLTAYHVFSEAQGAFYFAGPHHLETLRYTVGPNSDEEHWDFMVLELSADTLGRLGRFTFLEVSDIDPNDRIMPHRFYAFIGFPRSKNKAKYSTKNLPNRPLAFTNVAAPPGTYALVKKQQEAAILLPFTREVIEDEILQPAPDLHGISGGGVWRIGDGDDIAACRLDDIKLVGVCIQEHPTEKLLEGLRIGLVTEAIRDHYPQLTEHLPPVSRFRMKSERTVHDW